MTEHSFPRLCHTSRSICLPILALPHSLPRSSVDAALLDPFLQQFNKIASCIHGRVITLHTSACFHFYVSGFLLHFWNIVNLIHSKVISAIMLIFASTFTQRRRNKRMRYRNPVFHPHMTKFIILCFHSDLCGTDPKQRENVSLSPAIIAGKRTLK